MDKCAVPSKCAVRDTYDFRGMWKCECDAMNLSKNIICWKCGKPKKAPIDKR